MKADQQRMQLDYRELNLPKAKKRKLFKDQQRHREGTKRNTTAFRQRSHSSTIAGYVYISRERKPSKANRRFASHTDHLPLLLQLRQRLGEKIAIKNEFEHAIYVYNNVDMYV